MSCICKRAGCSRPALDCDEGHCEEHLMEKLSSDESFGELVKQPEVD